MQARYYDPVVGRFYSNDPVGFSNIHNFNRFTYANNNPYKYIDPNGEAAARAFGALLGQKAAGVSDEQIIKNTKNSIHAQKEIASYLSVGLFMSTYQIVSDLYTDSTVAEDISGTSTGAAVSGLLGAAEEVVEKVADKKFGKLADAAKTSYNVISAVIAKHSGDAVKSEVLKRIKESEADANKSKSDKKEETKQE